MIASKNRSDAWCKFLYQQHGRIFTVPYFPQDRQESRRLCVTGGHLGWVSNPLRGRGTVKLRRHTPSAHMKARWPARTRKRSILTILRKIEVSEQSSSMVMWRIYLSVSLPLKTWPAWQDTFVSSYCGRTLLNRKILFFFHANSAKKRAPRRACFRLAFNIALVIKKIILSARFKNKTLYI